MVMGGSGLERDRDEADYCSLRQWANDRQDRTKPSCAGDDKANTALGAC